MRRVVLLAALAAAGAWVGPAHASTWCGTGATSDRLPQGVPGTSVHLIYAIPSDGVDRLSEVGSTIQSDAETIDLWWRGQDPTRTPRFDTFAFPCGLQVDISSVRLPATGPSLAPTATRFRAIVDSLAGAGFTSPYAKYLVYYDGPGDGSNACGAGAGEAGSGPSFAVVFLGACSDLSTSVIAAHELVHALGALPESGPPHPCPGDAGHPCDSNRDLLYPVADGTPLAGLVLDVGRDDYYGHSGAWWDVQDSRWLRRLDAQVHVSIVIRGAGTVESDVPGISCSVSCESDWDSGQQVTLTASPATGLRFVRWSGGCAGQLDCMLGLDRAATVTALFAPAAFPLSISVHGAGGVVSSASVAPCFARCRSAVPSFQQVALHAIPRAGWRFVRWSGGCHGSRPTCRLPMSAAAGAGAVFARKSAG